MTMQVKFDAILGRLREKDGEGDTPPSPSHTLTATTIGNSKTYYADESQTDSLTVTVELRYDGNLVDADAVPLGWSRVSLGTYTFTLADEGSVPATTFTYTPQGGSAMTATSQVKTLKRVFPAYWGTYPSAIVLDNRLDTVAASLAQQHRATSNVVNNVANVPADPNDDVWLWVVTHGSATVVDNNLGASIMNAPENAPDFDSPMQGADFDLSGYKVYVSTWPAESGQGGFGDLKINITL